MSDSETQRKLEKLKKLEQGNRARVRRYMEKVKGEGKKQLSAIVSGEIYEEITRRKNASNPPLTNGQVIEQAILGFIDTSIKTDVNINTSEPESDQGKEDTKQVEVIENPAITPSENNVKAPGDIPDRSDREAYKKWLVSKITDLRDNDGLSWEDVADKLELQGILSPTGKPISKTNAEATYRRGKKAKKS